jgi:septum site-determining protein MinC
MQKFPIKGFNEGLLITMREGNWRDLQNGLLQQIDSESAFFSNAKIALDVGDRELGAAQLSKLRDMLLDREIKLFAVLSSSSKTEATASTLGLSTRTSLLKQKESRLSAAILEGEPGLVIRKTIRSGSGVEYDGHVLVHGDLNPGAEISCTGSIFIWGKLRGTVHAGMAGADQSVICALQLDPISLRIANIEYRENKLLKKLRRKPVEISLEKGQFVLDYWDI